MLKIITGKYEIVASGLVHLLAEEESSMMIFDELQVKFLFKDDGGEPSIKGESEDEKILKITLLNFNSSLGQGNVNPLEIGKIKDGKLFLVFRVSSVREKNIKTFEYTFYLKNEE